MKLDIEEFLVYFDTTPDFNSLYEKIYLIKDHLVDLIIVLIEIKSV